VPVDSRLTAVYAQDAVAASDGSLSRRSCELREWFGLRTQASAVEQWKADGSKAAAATQTCLVDPTKVQIECCARDLAVFNLQFRLFGCAA
jgi:hypothetical protein